MWPGFSQSVSLSSVLMQFQLVWACLGQFDPVCASLVRFDLLTSGKNWFEPLWSGLSLSGLV